MAELGSGTGVPEMARKEVLLVKLLPSVAVNTTLLRTFEEKALKS